VLELPSAFAGHHVAVCGLFADLDCAYDALGCEVRMFVTKRVLVLVGIIRSHLADPLGPSV
jgi:hypothetical protein